MEKGKKTLTAPSTSKQFIRFSNDAIGLERILRLLESITILLASYPLLTTLLLTFLSSINVKSNVSVEHIRMVAVELRPRLGLARRFFRVFRWYEFFHSANVLYSTLSQRRQLPPKLPQSSYSLSLAVQCQPWIDLLGRTCNGMWFLLDASTIVDALQVNGLSIWGPVMQRVVLIEAQRFWLFALVCGIVSGVLKLVVLYLSGAESTSAKSKKTAAVDAPSLSGHQRAEIYTIAKTALTNAVDIVLPGSVVGWVNVHPGMIGIAMFCTSIVTGLDAWRRCGREVAA